jgi:hypothetical protein
MNAKPVPIIALLFALCCGACVLDNEGVETGNPRIVSTTVRRLGDAENSCRVVDASAEVRSGTAESDALRFTVALSQDVAYSLDDATRIVTASVRNDGSTLSRGGEDVSVTTFLTMPNPGGAADVLSVSLTDLGSVPAATYTYEIPSGSITCEDGAANLSGYAVELEVEAESGTQTDSSCDPEDCPDVFTYDGIVVDGDEEEGCAAVIDPVVLLYDTDEGTIQSLSMHVVLDGAFSSFSQAGVSLTDEDGENVPVETYVTYEGQIEELILVDVAGVPYRNGSYELVFAAGTLTCGNRASSASYSIPFEIGNL